MDDGPFKLYLPLPPSRNKEPDHHMARWRWRSEIKEETWLAAITRDENPMPSPDPPDPVRITAHYRIRHNSGIPSRGLRDPGSLQSSLKSVIDALKKIPANSDKLKWRNGLYTDFGYIVDDGPRNVTYGEHSQETVPTPDDEELILTIEPVDELPIDTNPPEE